MSANSFSISSSPPTGFSNVDAMMAIPYTKYAQNPSAIATIRATAIAKLAKPLSPTPENLGMMERTDIAIAKSTQLIEEAEAQLAKPVSDYLPAQLTAEEQAEKDAADEWQKGCDHANATIDRMMTKNQDLFQEVMDSIAEVEKAGFLLPDDVRVPSPPSISRVAEIPAVPEAVKSYIEKSKACASSFEPETAEDTSFYLEMKEQLDHAQAVIRTTTNSAAKGLEHAHTAIQKIAKPVEQSQTPVSKLVARNEFRARVEAQ
ncbi:hypothetical protein KC332_g14630 [Hortaea werneckii]|nr:hypothetical protein KC358_g16061 [Hortaea werneckii]KAI6805954.1 hypothetical protein KC350_g14383 [Hortaea werneckii]KAI6902526.1 hypothetical protein KC348_g16055 [Hortaea werneckii]KAI6926890.1 hypothetical protein KC341_g12498 [Hortaea werneckii]KAI6954960.1 hypothetical protein KC321_g16047 [Hortaea werneckii]